MSGPSADRDVIFRLDSNKGLKAKDLSAWDTNIRDVADPVNDKDAVNVRYLEDRAITDRTFLDSLITETTLGSDEVARWYRTRMTAGTFNTWTRRNGSSSTNDPAQVREIWAHKFNMSGYQFNWGER